MFCPAENWHRTLRNINSAVLRARFVQALDFPLRFRLPKLPAKIPVRGIAYRLETRCFTLRPTTPTPIRDATRDQGHGLEVQGTSAGNFTLFVIVVLQGQSKPY